MRKLLILILFSLISCSKEETCTYYKKVILSNEREAKKKCLGLPNNYPLQEIVLDTIICSEHELSDVRHRTDKWCGYWIREVIIHSKL